MKIAAEQMGTYTFQGMKDELSKRARVWPFGTGQYVEPHQDDDSFLRELFRVGLFELQEDGVKLERARPRI